MAAISLAGWAMLLLIAILVFGLDDPWVIALSALLGGALSFYQAWQYGCGGSGFRSPGAAEGFIAKPESVCLSCDPLLHPDSTPDAFPMKELAVAGAGEAADPRHLAPLVRREFVRGARELSVPAFASAAGLGLLILGIAWGRSLFLGGSLPVSGLVLALSFALMTGALGLAFIMPWRTTCLMRYRFKPDGFLVASGDMRAKHHVARGGRGSLSVAEVVFKDFADKETILLLPYSDLDEYFVSPAEERSLNPGDDWYDALGKRSRLPVPAWILYEKENPWNASLIGVYAAAPITRPI